MNPILIAVGIGLLVIIATLAAMVDHYMRAEERKQVLLNNANATVHELRRQLTLSDQYAAKEKQRADWLLARFYELRRELGLNPSRAHTECFDRWHDGGQPCPDCQLLLGVRGG